MRFALHYVLMSTACQKYFLVMVKCVLAREVYRASPPQLSAGFCGAQLIELDMQLDCLLASTGG